MKSRENGLAYCLYKKRKEKKICSRLIQILHLVYVVGCICHRYWIEGERNPSVFVLLTTHHLQLISWQRKKNLNSLGVLHCVCRM